MSLSPVLTSAISAAPGAVIAVISLVHAVRQTRGNSHLARAIAFFDLHDRLLARGPLVDPLASKLAAQMHSALLLKLEREGRANSYLFMREAASLEKPGDFLSAGLLILYGGVLTIGAISSATGVRIYATTADFGDLASCIILAVVGIALLTAGAVRLARRLVARRARRAVGLIDGSTLEGMEFYVRNAVRSARQFVAEISR